MLPFLLLSTRADDRLADEEHRAVARHMGVPLERVVQHRLEALPLPPEAHELGSWAGVVIGGSPFTASDDPAGKSQVQLRAEDELTGLTELLVREDFPTLGLCYGVGVLGLQRGAVVDGTHGEPLGAPTIRLTDAAAHDALLADLPWEFTAFVGHKEAITRPSPEMVVLASSADCPVQMFRIGRHVRATQFHPELDARGLATRVAAYAHLGYFEPSQSQALVEMARTTDVSTAHRVLSAFARVYG
ncbi:glutamine amidotransferase [Kytococcus sp. Marseille-QA3725]